MKATTLTAWALAALVAASAGCMKSNDRVDLGAPDLDLGALHPVGMNTGIQIPDSGCATACSMLDECLVLDEAGLTVAECISMCGMGYFGTGFIDCVATSADCFEMDFCF